MATCTLAGLEELLKGVGLATPIPRFLGARVLFRPIDIWRSYLADTTSNVFKCDAETAFDEAVHSSNSKDNGDLVVVLPRLMLRIDTKAKDLASKSMSNVRRSDVSVVQYTRGLADFVSTRQYTSNPLFVLPVPDGVHLRFFFSPKTLPQIVIPYINDRRQAYGVDTALGFKNELEPDRGHKRVVIEFSSPNLASEFTVAHFRSTIIGGQLASLYESRGWDVVRLNYLGDWGKPLGLLAVGWYRFGSEEYFQTNPMVHMLEVYEKIEELFTPEKEASKRARDSGQGTALIETQGIFAERDSFFKRMEEGDPEAIALWRRFRDASVAYYTGMYAQLGIDFDEYSGESTVSPESIAEVESVLKQKGICEESEGSWIVDFKKHCPKNLGTAIIRGRTGSTTYLLRDVAAVIDRDKKYGFDKMVYVVSSEQDSHFHRLFQTLQLMGREDLVARLEHVNFGKIQGMSSQLTRVHLLGDILDHTTSSVCDTLGLHQRLSRYITHSESSAEILSLTALIVQDGLTKRSNGYVFNTQKLTSLSGGTGLHMLECYAKLDARINAGTQDPAALGDLEYACLEEWPWIDVLRLLVQYPDVTSHAFRAEEPSLVTTYLLRLVEELDSCLDDSGEDDKREEDAGTAEPHDEDPPRDCLAQLAMYKVAHQVLRNGMRALGISPTAK